jgi:hypothetical protein
MRSPRLLAFLSMAAEGAESGICGVKRVLSVKSVLGPILPQRGSVGRLRKSSLRDLRSGRRTSS